MLTAGFKSSDYAGSAGMLMVSATSVATPACLIIIARELDFTLAEGGLFEIFRTSLMTIIMLASGFVAARYGKIRCLAAGSAFLGMGLLLYAFTPSYAFIFPAMIVVGMGSGMLEALINPLVRDAHPDNSGKFLNIVNGFWSVGVVGAALLAGQLLIMGISWRFIMGGLAVSSLILSIFFLRCTDHHFESAPQAGIRESLAQMGRILKSLQFWLFGMAMFFGGGVEGVYAFWSSSFLQKQYGADSRMGAVAIAIFASGMVLGRFVFGHSVGQARIRHLIFGSAVAGALISLRIAYVSGIAELYVVLFAVGVSIACFWPSILSIAGERMDVDASMLFILLAVAGIPGYGLLVWAFGMFSEQLSFQAAFTFVPLAFLLVALPIWVESRVRQRDPMKV
jgi:fucose permease